MSSSALNASQKELFGHPAGLFVLFFTEMWERFSYYGMRAILVLYLVSESTGGNPGLAWSNGDALALYGWYTMMVYVMSVPGGYIADKLLGQKKSVLVGWSSFGHWSQHACSRGDVGILYRLGIHCSWLWYAQAEHLNDGGRAL